MLYDVLPFVIFDYVSYSSYESINESEPDKALLADLDVIQNVTGSNAIILGEIGFARSRWSSERAVARVNRVLNAALSWGVAYIFQWNLYDQSAGENYGAYDLTGAPTALEQYYKQQFEAPHQQDAAFGQ